MSAVATNLQSTSLNCCFAVQEMINIVWNKEFGSKFSIPHLQDRKVQQFKHCKYNNKSKDITTSMFDNYIFELT